MSRYSVFEQVESNLTTMLGGRDYVQTHTLSPYFHEIGREKHFGQAPVQFGFRLLDFECILRLDNRQAVRCDSFDPMKAIRGNKKLEIPSGCER